MMKAIKDIFLKLMFIILKIHIIFTIIYSFLWKNENQKRGQACNLYIMDKRNLKQALNNELVSKKLRW